MIKDGIGGANTLTGLAFEGKTDLATFLNKQKGYKVEKDKVYYRDELVARVFKKHQFYKFLEEYGIDWKEILSKQLLPDDCIYVIIDNTLFIIECKFQQVAGSVDEKLQTCDFKKKQYQKLLELDEVKLNFDDSALTAIAKKAQERDTGARALRAIIEEFMLDIMYEIPKDDNIGEVTITGDYINGTGGPVIEIRTDNVHTRTQNEKIEETPNIEPEPPKLEEHNFYEF